MFDADAVDDNDASKEDLANRLVDYQVLKKDVALRRRLKLRPSKEKSKVADDSSFQYKWTKRLQKQGADTSKVFAYCITFNFGKKH